jgi:hypothetical protein
MRSLRAVSFLVLVLAGCAVSDAPPPAVPWSPAQIAWRGFDEGLQDAKQRHVPVCLVFSTTWCPHCANFAKVFTDPQIIETSKQLVMVHIDSDQSKELSARYAPDGEYIPRTFFTDANGNVITGIKANGQRFMYFYDEKSPKALLAGMKAAVAFGDRSR